MVVLDIKGVKHRINKEKRQTYRYQIAISKENLEKLNINPNEITNEQFKPVKVLNIKDFENLQKKESVEKQEAVAILNKKINDSESIIKDKDKEILELKLSLQSKNDKIDTLEKNTKELQKENNTLDLRERDNNKLIKENTELLRKNRTIKKELTSKYQTQIDELNNQVFKLETINNSKDNELQNTEKIYQKQHNQLQEKYDQLNKDLTKSIALNQLQNQAFKIILELGLFDLIRNKHKKIAKEQIKKLDHEKPVYELASENE
jgi:chromosome segregation ATPase